MGINFRLDPSSVQSVSNYVSPAHGPTNPDVHMSHTLPTTDGRYIGAGFQPQTPTGTLHTDAFDDRVDYLATEDGTGSEGLFHWRLPADDQSTGHSSVYGSVVFGGITYAENPTHSYRDPAHIQVNPDGDYFATLRGTAGYPLVAVTDEAWAIETNDTIGDSANNDLAGGLLTQPRHVMEKAIDIPHRASLHPASIQNTRPFDVIMGAWPWLGEKAALQQPVVSTPLYFPNPIEDGLPSPTGAAGTYGGAYVPNTVSLAPMPLTFRVPPSPWDTGQASSFMDSGAYQSSGYYGA